MILNKFYSWIIIILNIHSNVHVLSELTEKVATEKGLVQGEILKTVRNAVPFSSFRGIRYAKPPLGDLRFKPPQEVEPWTETFQATSEATPCPQIKDDSYLGDEDCLNLNVYTPKIAFSENNSSLLPVMVWIFSGGYRFGSINMSNQGPDYLIENGVVVIAMNYRLGALGFLSLDLPDVTGNTGLKDQRFALEWVQNNINAFGGDPNSVTLFGLSSGASSVDLHILSDASHGLFHRSISMSSPSVILWMLNSQSQAKNHAFELAQLLGHDISDEEDLLQMLYNESAENIVTAAAKITSDLRPFKPVRENKQISGDSAFLSECIIDKLKSGNFNQLPHMVGLLESESIRFLSSLSDLKKVAQAATNQSKLILNDIPADVTPAISSIMGKLPSDVLEDIIDKAINDTIQNITDLVYISPTNIKQQLMQKFVPVYYYRVSIAPELSLHKLHLNIDLNGAAHGDDMAYLWYISDLDVPSDLQDPVVITRDRMTRLWTNFAKYGDPTPQDMLDPLLNITWPVSGPEGLHLDININLSIKQRPVNSNVEKLESFYFSMIDKAVDCVSQTLD